MRAARTLMLFALLPLFTACQLFESEPAKPSTAGLTRMQGEPRQSPASCCSNRATTSATT